MTWHLVLMTHFLGAGRTSLAWTSDLRRSSADLGWFWAEAVPLPLGL